MMLRHNLICLLFLFTIQLAGAQNAFTNKWGKVQPEDLQRKSCEWSPESAAMVLFSQGNIKFELVNGITYRFKHHRRLQVFDVENMEPIDIHIPYRLEEPFIRIASFKAQLILPNGEKKAINKKYIQDWENEDGEAYRRVLLPDLTNGTIIEYRYELISNDISILPHWHFQENIPVAFSRLTTEIPEWLDYIQFYNPAPKPLHTEQDRYELVLEGGETREKWMRGDAKVQVVKKRYTLEELPPIEPLPFNPTIEDCRSGLCFMLEKIDFPNGESEQYLPSWEQLADTIRLHPYFGQQLSDSKNHARLVQAARPILDKATTEHQKALELYQFLGKEVKWNGEFDLLSGESLDFLFQEKVANSAALNLMLMVLLREADIKAYPLLTRTKRMGKVIQRYPILMQFNHALVEVHTANSSFVMDLSDPGHPADYPSREALNDYAWLLHEDHTEWITLEAPKSSEVYKMIATLNEEGQLDATLEGRFIGYYADRSQAPNGKAEDWDKLLGDVFASTKNVNTAYEHDPVMEGLTTLKLSFEANLNAGAGNTL